MENQFKATTQILLNNIENSKRCRTFLESEKTFKKMTECDAYRTKDARWEEVRLERSELSHVSLAGGSSRGPVGLWACEPVGRAS